MLSTAESANVGFLQVVQLFAKRVLCIANRCILPQG